MRGKPISLTVITLSYYLLLGSQEFHYTYPFKQARGKGMGGGGGSVAADSAFKTDETKQ